MLTSILQRFQWVVDHPGEVVVLATIIEALAFLIGAVVFVIWRRHEGKKAEAARRQFLQKMAQGHSESQPWPRPPGPKGGDWRSRRAS